MEACNTKEEKLIRLERRNMNIKNRNIAIYRNIELIKFRQNNQTFKMFEIVDVC